MNRLLTDISAAERARWLAELAEALEQAERLVWSLGNLPRSDPEIAQLYASLDAVRNEVQSLRSKRVAPVPPNLRPFWSESSRTREALGNR